MCGVITWGDQVVTGVVNGHPSQDYRDRPRSILAAVTEARRWAQRPFIRHGARTVTFADHERMVSYFAEFLQANGVRRGDRVGIY